MLTNFIGWECIDQMVVLKNFLDDQFKIKDLGLVHYFPKLEISAHPDGYIINTSAQVYL